MVTIECNLIYGAKHQNIKSANSRAQIGARKGIRPILRRCGRNRPKIRFIWLFGYFDTWNAASSLPRRLRRPSNGNRNKNGNPNLAQGLPKTREISCLSSILANFYWFWLIFIDFDQFLLILAEITPHFFGNRPNKPAQEPKILNGMAPHGVTSWKTQSKMGQSPTYAPLRPHWIKINWNFFK